MYITFISHIYIIIVTLILDVYYIISHCRYSKIDKYNLLVPVLQKQMFHIKLDDLAKEALAIAPNKIKKVFLFKK